MRASLWRRRPVSDEELVAFADGRLGRCARRRVSAHLRKQPEDADRVRAYLGQDARLRRLYDPVLAEPIPTRLRRLVEMPAPEPRSHRTLATAVASSLLVLAGLVVGVDVLWERWVTYRAAGSAESADRDRIHDRSDPEASRVSEFTEAVFALRAAEVGSASATRAASPHARAAPGLAQLGLQIESARERRQGDFTLTEYVYRDADGAPIAVYASGSETDSPGPTEPGALRLVERGGTYLVEWSLHGRSYVLAAERPPAELTRLAERARANLPGPTLAGGSGAAAANLQGVPDLPYPVGASPSTPAPVIGSPGPRDM